MRHSSVILPLAFPLYSSLPLSFFLCLQDEACLYFSSLGGNASFLFTLPLLYSQQEAFPFHSPLGTPFLFFPFLITLSFSLYSSSPLTSTQGIPLLFSLWRECLFPSHSSSPLQSSFILPLAFLYYFSLPLSLLL